MLPNNQNFDEQKARVDSLRAFVAEQEGELAKAMELLGSNEDPVRFRARLGTLIRSKDFDTAFQLVADEPLHEKWGDLAVYACVASGNHVKAIEKIHESKGSLEPDVVDKFRLAFAESAFQVNLRDVLNPSFLQFRALESEEEVLLEAVGDILWPIARKIQVNEIIQSKIQEFAVYWLANWSRAPRSPLRIEFTCAAVA